MKIKTKKQSVKVLILPPGIVNEHRSTMVSGRFFPSEFTDATGYWNWNGGRLLCALRGHRFKWTTGVFYSDGCSPWGLQCVRCLASTNAPHPSDGTDCHTWNSTLLAMATVERARVLTGE